MSSQGSANKFSNAVYAYIFSVAACGAVVVWFSVVDLLGQGPDYRFQWLTLVALTVVSGLLPVTVNSLHVTVSVSETFVIAGTLLFGRSGGTVLVVLDALFMLLYLRFSRGIRWQQVIFNLGLPAVSIWVSAFIAGIEPLFRTELDTWFVLQLALFTALHFLINTWLLTFVLALQERAKPTTIWWRHFREVLLNYAAGGSIAALLVFNSREVKPEFVLAILPLLIVLFLTYRWSNQRIEIERSRNNELNRVFLSTIEALALAIDAKDQVTHGHIRRVQRYTVALAKELGVREQRDLDAIRAAALLHDTGKLAVPEHILNKPGPLTPSEFDRMKVHADVGADIIKSIDFPYPVEPIVRHHHENWNGTGYPGGLKGQEIPVGARILAVVDCYDALTSDRPYRPRYSREHAEQVLRERRGSWYDPWVVDAFLRIVGDLERADAEEEKSVAAGHSSDRPASNQLDVIAATTAEEREFNELRRELPLANSLPDAAEVLFRHLRRVVPTANVTLFVPSQDSGELAVAASTGVGTSAIEGMTIPVGERVSGWALAHKQAVMNSNAALELGPVARTFSTPLRYALAVPILNGASAPLGVIACYGSEPFTPDHKRIVEGAATLFTTALSASPGRLSLPSQLSDARGSIVH